MPNFSINIYLKIIFFISLISILSALFIEHFLGHQPCNLCLIERIPYIFALILIAFIFIFKKNRKFLIVLLILNFIFSLTISVYHYGIEQGFFQESAVCNIKNFAESVTKEDLLRQLNEKNISCKDVTFKIFGLSLTSINIVISLLFIITLANIYIKYEKNK